MSYYLMGSPRMTTTSTPTPPSDFFFSEDFDFSLLFSFDDEDNKALFDELEEIYEAPFLSVPFMNEIIESDVFDEVSVSSDNDMPATPIKLESNKKRCNKRKHCNVERTTPSTSFTKKQKVVRISPTAPLDYTNKFIKTLNCGDMTEIEQSLQSMCSEKVRVTKHYYTSIEDLRVQEGFNRAHPEEKQEEEYLSTMQFQSMTDFLHYLKMINCVIPDGTFAINEARCCHKGEKSSVFIASFSYSGTSLCGNMNLFANLSLMNDNRLF